MAKVTVGTINVSFDDETKQLIRQFGRDVDRLERVLSEWPVRTVPLPMVTYTDGIKPPFNVTCTSDVTGGGAV